MYAYCDIIMQASTKAIRSWLVTQLLHRFELYNHATYITIITQNYNYSDACSASVYFN